MVCKGWFRVGWFLGAIGVFMGGPADGVSAQAGGFVPFTAPATMNSPTITSPKEVVVEGRSGAISYSYPFSVPPGTGGLTPELELVYSSLVKNTPYGWGWTLPFLGQITRSTRKQVPGYCNVADAGCADVYELDGSLLVRDPESDAKFHKEHSDFSRIEYVAAGDYWRVTQRDGTQFFYGSGAGTHSRIRTGTNETGPTYQWSLDRIQDARGNYMVIDFAIETHSVDGISGYTLDTRPETIRYSYHVHPMTGVETTLDGTGKRLVQLVWGDRRHDAEGATAADVPTSHRAGMRLSTTKRLVEVITGLDDGNGWFRATDGTLDSADQILARYELNYDLKPTTADPNHDPFSKLLSIQMHGEDGTPFPSATVFGYSDTPAGFDQERTVVNDSGVPAIRGRAFGTGGYADQYASVVGSNPLGSESTYDYGEGDIMDMDGDGIPDRVFIDGTESRHWYVAKGRYNPAGPPTFDPPVLWPLADGGTKNLREVALSGTKIDAVSTYAYICNIPQLLGGFYWCHTANCANASYVWGTYGWDAVTCSAPLISIEARYMFGSASCCNYTRSEALGYGYISETVNTVPAYSEFDQAVVYADLIDMDGDGLPDRVTTTDPDPDNGVWEWNFIRNNGSGFEASQAWPAPNPYPLLEASETDAAFGSIEWTVDRDDETWPTMTPVRMVDVNGDGKPDHLVLKESAPQRMIVSINNGAGFEPAEVWSSDVLSLYSPTTHYDDSNKATTTADLIDFDGDGLPDKILAGAWYGAHDVIPAGTTEARFNLGNGFDESNGVQSSVDIADVHGMQQTLASEGGTKSRIYSSMIDMNGDGIVDFVHASSDQQRFEVYYGLGDGRFLEEPVYWTIPTTGHEFYSIRETYAGLSYDSGDGSLDFSPNPDGSGVASFFGAIPGAFTKPVVSDMVDLNGDGLIDYVAASDYRAVTSKPYAQTHDNNWKFFAHPGPGGLLTSVTNELGGITELQYSPSIRFAEKVAEGTTMAIGAEGLSPEILPQRHSVWVLTDMEVRDGRTGTPTQMTHYEYAEPRFCPMRRENLGMRMSEERDVLGNVGRTFYHQLPELNGSVFFSEKVAADGTGLSYTKTDFEAYDAVTLSGTPIVGSTFAVPLVSWTTVFNPETGNPHTQTTRSVINSEDQKYGTVTQTMNDGVDNVPGNLDDSRTVSNFCHNTEKWIIGLPCKVTERIGAGEIVGRTWLFYDDQGINQPPILGLVTEKRELVDSTRFVSEKQRYDIFGNPIEYSNGEDSANGEITTTMTYDPTYQSFVSTVNDRLGRMSQFEIDPLSGQVAKTLSHDGDLRCASYDAFQRLASTSRSEGSTTLDDDCEQDLSAFDFHHFGDPDAQFVETTVYAKVGTAAGKSRAYYDGLGRTYRETQSRFSSAGRIDTEHLITVTEWDALGRPTCESLPSIGHPNIAGPACTSVLHAEAEFDQYGRVLRTELADSGGPTGDQKVTYVYGSADIDGVPGYEMTTEQRIHGSPSRIIESGTNAAGQQVSVEDVLLGRLTLLRRDPQGRIGTVVSPVDPSPDAPEALEQIVIGYDFLDRRTSVTKGGSTWSYEYDLNGNLVKITSPRGPEHDVVYVYDDYGRLEKKDLFDEPGEESLNDTFYAYQDDPSEPGLGRLLSVSYQDYQREYGYDFRGQTTAELTTIVDQLNGTGEHVFGFAFDYDFLGRTTSTTYPDLEEIRNIYDGQIFFAKESVQDGSLMSGIELNADGQVRSIHYNKGNFTTEFDYYPENRRLKSIETSHPMRGTIQHLFYEDHDAAGNIGRIRDDLGLLSQTFTYDDAFRLGAASSAGTLSYGSYPFSYESTGNVSQLGPEISAIEYGQNNHPRDALTAYTDNAGAVTLDYDADGNLKLRVTNPGTPDEVAETLTWDANNRMKTFERSGSGLTYQYDYTPAGTRFRKLVFSADGLPLQSILYVGHGYESHQRVRELQAPFSMSNASAHYKDISYAGKRTMRIKYAGPGTGNANVLPATTLPIGTSVVELALWLLLVGLLWMFGQSVFANGWRQALVYTRAALAALAICFALPMVFVGCRPPDMSDHSVRDYFNIHSDHLGTPRLITNGKGMVQARVALMPFGEIHRIVDASNDDIAIQDLDVKQLFAGYEYDEESGLYYANARYYDSRIGRFISPDPDLYGSTPGVSFDRLTTSSQAVNAYAYVENRPTMATDPTGRSYHSYVSSNPYFRPGSTTSYSRSPFSGGGLFTSGSLTASLLNSRYRSAIRNPYMSFSNIMSSLNLSASIHNLYTSIHFGWQNTMRNIHSSAPRAGSRSTMRSIHSSAPRGGIGYAKGNPEDLKGMYADASDTIAAQMQEAQHPYADLSERLGRMAEVADYGTQVLRRVGPLSNGGESIRLTGKVVGWGSTFYQGVDIIHRLSAGDWKGAAISVGDEILGRAIPALKLMYIPPNMPNYFNPVADYYSDPST